MQIITPEIALHLGSILIMFWLSFIASEAINIWRRSWSHGYHAGNGHNGDRREHNYQSVIRK